jgi:DNA-binding LytR/AlgR family response regulator
MNMMRVLIIEDEPYAQNELQRLLRQTGKDLEITACLDSVADTVEWLHLNSPPDLIFADIQLADGLSFEIFRQVRVTVPVIFTTAFNEYAIQAFQVNSIDYLLKPIKIDELTKALNKLALLKEQFESSANPSDQLLIEKLIRSFRTGYKSRFVVRVGDQYKHIDVTETAYFYAEDNEVLLVTTGNRRYIIDHTLDELNQMLDPGLFFRISRSYLVGIKAIGKVSKYFNSRLILELIPPAEEKVLISRVRAGEFLKWMDK